MNIPESLISELNKIGLDKSIAVFDTGKVERQDSQWFVGKTLKIAGKTALFASFGDFRLGDKKYSWTSSDDAGILPEEDYIKLIQEIEQERKISLSEKLERQKLVAIQAQENFETCLTSGQTDYMKRKQIDNLYGARIIPDSGESILAVPMYDMDGKLWNYQKISDKEFSGTTTNKLFLKGGRKKGLFFPVAGVENPEKIYICEGYATAVSVYRSIGPGFGVVCAFDSGNLKPVADALRGKYASAGLIICADNDCHKGGVNTGLEAAHDAATHARARVVYPTGLEAPYSDYNDLYIAQGLEAVANSIRAEIPAELPVGSALSGKVAVARGCGSGLEMLYERFSARGPDIKPDKEGKLVPKQPPQQDYADDILDFYGDFLVKQGRDLFLYTGTHWVWLDDRELDLIRQQIQQLCGGRATAENISSILRLVIIHTPSVPHGVNLFMPSMMHSNFLDGTLTLMKDAMGEYSSRFGEHNKLDYLTWTLPVKYKTDRNLVNSKLEGLINEALQGDADHVAKRMMIQESAGALLLTAFPQIIFFVGVSGSTKSTLAKIFLKPFKQNNFDKISFIDPCNMEGFMSEGMLSKVLNINTDIDETKPIPRGFLKKFEDMLPFPINRKGLKVIHGILPPVHLYCCNTLPPNFEGSGKALIRRISLIEFKREVALEPGFTVKKFYEDTVYGSDPEGVHAYMLRGLDLLLANQGKFTASMSEVNSRAVMAWQMESDPVARFLEELKTGVLIDSNTKLIHQKEGKIKFGTLWENFSAWHLTVFKKQTNSTRHKFYDRVRGLGYCVKIVKGYDHFAGIGVEVPGEGTEF